MAIVVPNHSEGIGPLIRQWRRVRGKSQLDLALDANVSPRHVSFLETGRSRPSRAMVLALARTLDVPNRERNTLLVAAGFAPLYRESDWDAPELESARRAFELILEHQEPYPAVVLNRSWDVMRSNRAANRLFGMLLGEPSSASEPSNIIRLLFDPSGLRPLVSNWEEVAETLIQRVHREAVGGVLDARTGHVLSEALACPGVPKAWSLPEPERPLTPLIPIHFRKGSLSLRYFSAVTTLGTAQDITLQELRVEAFFPADSETAEAARAAAVAD